MERKLRVCWGRSLVLLHGAFDVAKKQVKKVLAIQDEKATKPVRLDLLISDVERLEVVARARGLNKAAYARQAVLRRSRPTRRSDPHSRVDNIVNSGAARSTRSRRDEVKP